ncbi:MAG: hypothetical protein IPI95_02550 [Flavobacteriales bacterium]|nr:hypothetical protein [Flavobacteriales bacterium]
MRTRTLVLFSSVILVAGSLHAQLPRIILQSGGTPQVFTTVNEALTAAQPNDKLYFSGGTFLEAAGITIDKPLHFIGAGISPDTANVTGVTTLSTGGSTRITILTEAGGSTFTGINFNPGGNIQYGTDPNDDDPKDLIFQRCAFAKAIGMAIEEGASASSSFDECIFRGTITGGASNAVITNSILDGATLSLFRPSGLIIRNSVVLDARLQNSGNAIVQNCVHIQWRPTLAGWRRADQQLFGHGQWNVQQFQWQPGIEQHLRPGCGFHFRERDRRQLRLRR